MDMLKSKTIDRICCFTLAMMLVLTRGMGRKSIRRIEADCGGGL